MKAGKKRFLGKYDSKKHGWLLLGKDIVVAVLAVLLVFYIVIGMSRVDGQSMEPTLDDRQIVMYWRLGDNYSTGDIVAIKMPNGDRYVKRIVGEAGDVIDIRSGYVYRNGERLSESYTGFHEGKTEPQGEKVTYPYTVEEGTYFVLGDNREASMDSRTFGAVIKESIKGKLVFEK